VGTSAAFTPRTPRLNGALTLTRRTWRSAATSPAARPTFGGAGSLTLSGLANSFSGGINLNAGTLIAGGGHRARHRTRRSAAGHVGTSGPLQPGEQHRADRRRAHAQPDPGSLSSPAWSRRRCNGLTSAGAGA